MTRPAMPRRITIGHLTYTVTRDKAYIDAESVKAGGELAGVSSSTDQKIGIAEGFGPDYEADTVVHEILHQCLRASGYDPDDHAGKDGVEEQTIKAMTGPLLSTLRRNPKLVAYLLGGEPNQREAGRRHATRRKGGPNDGRTRTSTERPSSPGQA